MVWWGWVLSGLFLLAVELLAVGNFYIFFFGIGAILVGFLTAVGWAGPAWMQWLLFSTCSLLTLALLRKRLLMSTAVPIGRPDRDDFIGLTAVAMEALAPSGMGRVEMRGTNWAARNVGLKPIAQGDLCTVTEIEGLTLGVLKLE